MLDHLQVTRQLGWEAVKTGAARRISGNSPQGPAPVPSWPEEKEFNPVQKTRKEAARSLGTVLGHGDTPRAATNQLCLSARCHHVTS